MLKPGEWRGFSLAASGDESAPSSPSLRSGAGCVGSSLFVEGGQLAQTFQRKESTYTSCDTRV